MPHILSTVGWISCVAGWCYYQQRHGHWKTKPKNIKVGKLAVVTRIHGDKSLDSADKERKLAQLISHVQDYADVLIICIGSTDRKVTQTYADRYQEIVRGTSTGKIYIEILELDPWGYFINSLNHALTKAADLQCSHIMYQVHSIEAALNQR